MATSAVEICNLALANIQAEGSIEDLDPTKGEEERHCALWYDELRLQTLEAHDWTFATEQVALADSGDTLLDTRWASSYQYPSACVRFLRIVNTAHPLDAVPHAIVRSSSSGSRIIVTNMAEAVGEYVRDITDPAEFSHTFVVALSWWLGAHIAVPLTGKKSRRDTAIEMFNALAPAARVQDANQEDQHQEQEASWLAAR